MPPPDPNPPSGDPTPGLVVRNQRNRPVEVIVGGHAIRIGPLATATVPRAGDRDSAQLHELIRRGVLTVDDPQPEPQADPGSEEEGAGRRRGAGKAAKTASARKAAKATKATKSTRSKKAEGPDETEGTEPPDEIEATEPAEPPDGTASPAAAEAERAGDEQATAPGEGPDGEASGPGEQ